MPMSRNLNHMKAVSLKFGLLGLLLAATLPWAGFGPARYVVVAAAVLTASLYWAGDLYVFPHYGNLVAAIGDGVMAAAMLYAMQLALPGSRISAGWALTAGVLVGAGEFLLHRLLKRLDVVANDAPQVMPKAWERKLGRWLTDDEHWREPKEVPAPHPEYMGSGRP